MCISEFPVYVQSVMYFYKISGSATFHVSVRAKNLSLIQIRFLASPEIIIEYKTKYTEYKTLISFLYYKFYILSRG